jgi:hypothetical protein
MRVESGELRVEGHGRIGGASSLISPHPAAGDAERAEFVEY